MRSRGCSGRARRPGTGRSRPRRSPPERPGRSKRCARAKYNLPMGFLSGKKILVTGLLSNRSIAFGVAKAARREGAELALTYQNERFKDRAADMAKELGAQVVLPCEVTSDAEISDLFINLKKQWDGLDGLVHAIAFAPREAIAGDFLDGLSREAFAQAHDISVYSFPALAKAALPMMQGRRAALVTLTYLGAARVVPNYNTMGLAKASLEASVRYLAASLGPRSEEHTSELQSQSNLVCRLLLEKKKHK